MNLISGGVNRELEVRSSRFTAGDLLGTALGEWQTGNREQRTANREPLTGRRAQRVW
jgi:hypothetical protein